MNKITAMNKIKLTLMILMLLPGIIFAQKVEKTDAQKIAKEVYKRNNQGKDTKLKDVIILGDKSENDTLLYIVPFEESGYTIISAYRAARPVLVSYF